MSPLLLGDGTVIEATEAGDVTITQGQEKVRLEHADLRTILSTLHEVWASFERKPFGD